MSRLAADMTVDEFAEELKSMWEEAVNITGIERDKNNRSYLGKRNSKFVCTQVKGAASILSSPQAKLAKQRGDNGFTKGKLL